MEVEDTSICMTWLITVREPGLIANPDNFTLEKPLADNRISYIPGSIAKNVNSPREFDVASLVPLLLDTTIAAPGIAAPEGSVSATRMVPSVIWECAAIENIRVTHKDQIVVPTCVLNNP